MFQTQALVDSLSPQHPPDAVTCAHFKLIGPILHGVLRIVVIIRVLLSTSFVQKIISLNVYLPSLFVSFVFQYGSIIHQFDLNVNNYFFKSAK